MRILVMALAASAMLTGAAEARQICGATVHTQNGETRAYFRNVLGACRTDSFCSAVISLADPSHQAAYLQQLRVARPTPGAAYQLELTAVTPLPTATGAPMSLAFGNHSIDITQKAQLTANSANVFGFTDRAAADDVINRLKGGRSVRWTYASASGPHTATFSLNGLTAALTWVDCMGSTGHD